MTETEMREAIDTELDQAAGRFMVGDKPIALPSARQIAVTYAVDAYARGLADGNEASGIVDPTFVDTYCRLVIELLANKTVGRVGDPCGVFAGEDIVETTCSTARRIIDGAIAYGRGL